MTNEVTEIGMELKKKRGRKPLSADKIKVIFDMTKEGKSVKEIAEVLKLTIQTIYKYLKAIQ